MELQTIIIIREKRDSIREKIKSINYKENDKGTYGQENEYSHKEIIIELKALLTDISTLTQYPKKFARLSTYKERSDIFTKLNDVERFINSPAQLISNIESLKLIIRNYNVRSISERQIEFEKEIQEIRKIKIQLQETLNDSNEIKDSIVFNKNLIEKNHEQSNTELEKIKEDLSTIVEEKISLVNEVDQLKQIYKNINSMKVVASENLDSITECLNESKSNEKIIKSFSNRVLDGELRLDTLEQLTKDNLKKVEEYEEERKNILKESTKLIESAKEALNYKTAEGISASFQSQYQNANNGWIFRSWIVGALFCLLLTIGLGMWILENIPDEIGILIARISLLSLPIIGAIFCANQYSKQKNIIEDYAYKMVLSKAIVGFSEQLKKNGTEENEEYVHYIKTALEEIHKDPLRKRESKNSINKKSASLNELVEIAEKLVKIARPE